MAKYKMFLLRLDAEDVRNREALERHYREKHGREVTFADILRRLMAREVQRMVQQKER